MAFWHYSDYKLILKYPVENLDHEKKCSEDWQWNFLSSRRKSEKN